MGRNLLKLFGGLGESGVATIRDVFCIGKIYATVVSTVELSLLESHSYGLFVTGASVFYPQMGAAILLLCVATSFGVVLVMK
jgi:hypothetical protein